MTPFIKTVNNIVMGKGGLLGDYDIKEQKAKALCPYSLRKLASKSL